MPRIEDFPPHTQRALEGRQSREEDERGPLSLLRRLAGVGLGRRDDVPAPREEPTAGTPPNRPASATQPRSFAQRAAQIQRGGRPAQGNLDAQGRSAASRPQEDELEIPAFLRRQSN